MSVIAWICIWQAFRSRPPRSLDTSFSELLEPLMAVEFIEVNMLARFSTYESTKRSLLSQFGFFGLKFRNLLKRTWATGAIPMGAPGCPELAFLVASTWTMN